MEKLAIWPTSQPKNELRPSERDGLGPRGNQHRPVFEPAQSFGCRSQRWARGGAGPSASLPLREGGWEAVDLVPTAKLKGLQPKREASWVFFVG